MAEAPRRKTRRQVAVVRTANPRMQDWMDGKIKPEELTDEEVNKMRLMDSDGHFRGRASVVLPRDLAMAFRSEQQKRLMAWFAEQVPTAQRAYKELLESRHLAPGDAARLRAAEGVFERVIGKVSAQSDVHLVVDKGETFDDVLEGVLVDVEEDDD